ncbi:hypothetical protein [Paenibacillus sp. CF384]|uniref:hypothetical protein n=1 Tax=Paenibacillus sp. CF384 TaxID=1884382 RepID=UPI00089A67F4|nr:hypothetical protein [Paenibacillus sp. CF384]SDX27937.1 hypothetical protein SAMN05518855_1011132 [Paenibacillus sp. CF384]
MRLIQRAGLSLLLASTVILPVSNLAQPNHAFAAAAVVNNIKAFSLGGGSTAQITDLQFLYGDNEKTAYFTVSVYNNSNKELDFSDFWVELWTKKGTKYSIKMNEQDAKKTKVVAKTTTDYHFTAKVNPNLNLSDFSFKLIKWDFSQANYTRTIGQVSVPSTFNPIVPAATGKVVKIGNKKMSSILAKSQFAVISGQLEGALVYRVTNYSSQTIALNNLNYYIKRSGGTLSKLSADASGDQQLAPGASKEIQLYGTLPITKIDPNMQLIVTSSDEETKTETPIATYTVKPLSLEQVYVKPGKLGKLSIEGNAVNTKIRDAFYNQDAQTQSLSLYLNFNNAGKSSVSLPTYSYYILTSTGAMYPAKQSQGATAPELSPGIEKEQYLQFTLPAGVKTDSLKLIIKKTSEENKKGYVVGLFQVPPKSSGQNISTAPIKYVTKQGMFEFSLLRGERLPWGEQDMINALISVKNTQFDVKSLPNLKASIQLGDYKVDDKDIQLIKTEQIVAIGGNTYTTYIVSTKVPYTFAASDVTVSLSEATGEGDAGSTPIGTFQLKNSQLKLPTIKSTAALNVTGIGRKASLQINHVNTYVNADDDTKLLYAEFDYSSLEQRFANLANLQAYFKTKDGNYVPANFQNIKDKITPNKQNLVMAYATFPENYDLTDVQLIIGQGITAGQLTAPDGVADGYVNAVQYEMPIENSAVLPNFENMVINPYKLSMTKLSPSLQDAYKINIDFEYDLAKTVEYEKLAGTHQLVVELVDRDNKFEHVFELEKGNGALKVGEDIKESVSFEDEKLWGIIYREFTVNVYDQFQGHKKLLATKVLNQAMTNG